jgi:hypothetical protein
MLFYATFPLAGVVLAYWFGLGWFFLMVAIRVVLSSMPAPRGLVTRLLFGKETSNNLQAALQQRPGRAIKKALALPTVLIYLSLAVIGFLKLNIPLKALIEMLLK